MTADTQWQPKENEPRIYSVSELTGDIKAILEAAFDTVWLEGEISNYRLAASKHAYFVLKDEKAQIRCVMFRNYGENLNFKLTRGH